MQNELVWNDLRYFLATARAHSLTDAGRHLGVSASTVARRIDTLEQALSRRLFRRRRDGYALTPAGERLIANAEAAETRILGFQRNTGVAPTEPAGVVRLATPEFLAHELIVPRLGDFLETYPALLLELLSNVHPVLLARDEADDIVRAVRLTQGAYTLRQSPASLLACSLPISTLHARDTGLSRWACWTSVDHLGPGFSVPEDGALADGNRRRRMRGVAHQYVHRAAGRLPRRLRPRRASDYDRRKVHSQTGAPRVATLAS